MSPPDYPLISVVVPSFNQGRFLRANLESIFRQQYPRLEVVVMDAGSTDDSLRIIREFSPRLKYWRSWPDEGQAAAINEGVRHCTGDLVAWLNSDDYYWRDCLWTIADAFREFPGHGLYAGNGLRHFQETGQLEVFNRRHMALNRRALVEGLDYLLQPATFIARALWNELGGLDPNLHYCLDWDLFIRAARARPAVLINEVLAVSREWENTKTRSGGAKRAREVLEMTARHGHQTVTKGGMYLVLGALWDNAKGAVKDHLRRGMEAIQVDWKAQWGASDGFPVEGDPEDHTYLPFAGKPGIERRGGAMGPMPSVSVVVPSFNQAAFLPETLDSLLGQDYPGLEIIVMDGGSRDGSREVLRRYESRLAYWESERDRGPAHAINKGLARSRGEVVAWLSSDDVLARGAVREAAQMFAHDPELDLVYGNALYIDERGALFLADHGTPTGLYYGAMQPTETVPEFWTYVHAVPQPTVFFRRRLLERCGLLDESYRFIFDFELFYRFGKTAKVKKLERTQAFYRIHGQSKTSSWDHFLVELYRFSRPLWPRRSSLAFWRILRSYVRNHADRRYPGHGKWARRLRNCQIALTVWTGWGNPEAAARARAREAGPRRLAVAEEERKATEIRQRPNRGGAPVYRSFVCSFAWPRYPGLSGGEIRDFHLLRHLLSFSRVSWYSFMEKDNDGRADPLGPFVDFLYTPRGIEASRPELTGRDWAQRSRLRRAVERLSGLRRPTHNGPYHREGTERLLHLPRGLGRALQQDLVLERPDFLFVGPQINPIAMFLADVPPTTRVVMASYDVETVRVQRLTEARRGWRRGVRGKAETLGARRFEQDNLRCVDGIIAVSDLDRDRFVGLYGFPEDRVLVLPNGVDTDYFAFRPNGERKEKVVVFTGSMGYQPNAEAALRLVTRIMPRVRRSHPDAAVWLVGQGPSEALKRTHDGTQVVVTGAVPDVRAYLSAAAVCCVPLRAGSGTKLKVLEALSAGVPVVSSPLGVEGLSLTAGRHFLPGDTDAELAAAICRAFADTALTTKLAAEGRSLVERTYGWDTCVAGLRPWLDHIAGLPRRGRQPGIDAAARRFFSAAG